jgi:hypothetical protein
MGISKKRHYKNAKHKNKKTLKNGNRNANLFGGEKFKIKLKNWIEQNKDRLNLPDLTKNINNFKNKYAVGILGTPSQIVDWEALSGSQNENVVKALGKQHFADINWHELSKNPNPQAIHLLKKYPDKIEFSYLVQNSNPDAISLLEKELEKNPQQRIRWDILSANPNPRAIYFLIRKDNVAKIDWRSFSSNTNPAAIKFLEDRYFDKIDWSALSKNPSLEAVAILKKYPKKIDWCWLCENTNPKAIQLINQHKKYDKVCWDSLSRNPNTEAIKALKYRKDKIDWEALSGNTNPEAIKMLEKHPNHIDWYILSGNTSPEAIELLEKYPDYINWNVLSGNRSAIDFLKEHQERINWTKLSSNPNIFDMTDVDEDFKQILSEKKWSARKTVAEKYGHYSRINKFLKEGKTIDELEEILDKEEEEREKKQTLDPRYVPLSKR